MNNRKILLIAIIVLSIMQISFRWPVNNGRITSTFGESRWDHFHDGVDMISADNKVFPIDSGKLLFYWDQVLFPLENSPGGGNYKILKHKGDVYSLYMHLSDGYSKNENYSKYESIAMIGNSGHSFAKHLHFSVLNLIKRGSINPFLILPDFIDFGKIIIGDIHLKIGDRYILIRNNSEIRLTKHYPILFTAIDKITGYERLGVFKLIVSFNDKTTKIDFKNILFNKNGLTVGGKFFENVYDSKGFYKLENITYKNGINKIKIVTIDFAGNRSEREFIFNVKLDIKR